MERPQIVDQVAAEDCVAREAQLYLAGLIPNRSLYE